MPKCWAEASRRCWTETAASARNLEARIQKGRLREPAFEGYHAAARTVENVREQIRDIAGEAARRDVIELIRVGVGT